MYFRADKIEYFFYYNSVTAVFTFEGSEVARTSAPILFYSDILYSIGEFYVRPSGFYYNGDLIESRSTIVNGYFSLIPLSGFEIVKARQVFLSSTHLYRSVYYSYVGYIQVYFDWVQPFTFYSSYLPYYKKVCCNSLNFQNISNMLG